MVGFGVECPLCRRRVVTIEAPCECGFRFPRGYGEESNVPHVLDIEARRIRKGDDLFGAGVVTSAAFIGKSVRVEYAGTGATFWPDEIVTVRRGSDS